MLKHADLSSFQLFSGFGRNSALECTGIDMTLSVSFIDEQPQQLIMVPGHKEEDGEKNCATALTTV